MEPSSRVRGRLIRIRAAFAAPSEVAQPQRIDHGMGERLGAEKIAKFLAGVAPESNQARGERDHDEEEYDAEGPGHRAVRKHGVERACVVWVCRKQHRPLDEKEHCPQEKRQARRGDEADGHAIALEQRGERTRPSVLPVCLQADVREHFRKVKLELVRRRVLAGVIAGAAVVAQVGEVCEVALGEAQSPLERRKDRAKAFAITAGIADARHSRALFDQRDGNRSRRRHGARPPLPRCGRTRCRSPCRFPRRSPCRGRCLP